MAATPTILLMAWTLCCCGVVIVAAPLLALHCPPSASKGRRPFAAIAWSSAVVGFSVPLVAAVRGFNWATALLIAAAIPGALWVRCHGRASGEVLTGAARRAVLAMARPDRWIFTEHLARTLAGGCAAAVLVLAMAAAGFTGGDLRAPTALDIDTLWRARGLMTGTVAWDPLAAIVALLSRLSTAEALLTLLSLRVAIIVATAMAVLRLLRVSGVHQGPATSLPAIFVFALPTLPTTVWFAALMMAVCACCVQSGVHEHDRGQLWNAAAAATVAVFTVLPLAGNPGAVWDASGARYALEPSAAPREVLRLAREYRTARAILVAPPIQRLELHGPVSYTDLQTFVARYEGRVEDVRFRFGSTGRPLLVFVEMRPVAVPAPSGAFRFLSLQPPVYSIGRERWRLAQRARALCDAYRRTHAGTAVVYDDDQLRIYRFDA